MRKAVTILKPVDEDDKSVIRRTRLFSSDGQGSDDGWTQGCKTYGYRGLH